MKRLLRGLAQAVPVKWKLAAYQVWASLYVVIAPFAIMRAYYARHDARRDSRTVVLVSATVTVRQEKIAQALRRDGWRVIMLYQWNLPPHFPVHEYFDEVRRCVSEWQLLWWAASYAPQAFHAFSTSSDLFAETLIRHKPGPVIYDTKDIFERSLLPRLGLSASEIAARTNSQRYCIQMADGLCCRDLQVRRLCKEKGLARPRAVYFPEYCLDQDLPARKQWSPGDEIHVVSACYFGLETMGFQEHRFLELSRMLTAQGLHVHLYQLGPLPMPFEEAYRDYLQLEKDSPLFHLHRTVPLERLRQELRGYHVGMLMALDLSYRVPRRSAFMGLNGSEGSATAYEYVDAGLPVMCHKGFFGYATLVRYGLAIDATADMLADARQILTDVLSQDIAARVARARAAFNPRRHVGRLTRFYEELAAKYTVAAKPNPVPVASYPSR